ncbi:MAG TPA: hypothetical protein VEU47_03815 [Candidatus Cybelea sp.]|nr:hypothetical protein [Candidatus Cybelea sp.]
MAAEAALRACPAGCVIFGAAAEQQLRKGRYAAGERAVAQTQEACKEADADASNPADVKRAILDQERKVFDRHQPNERAAEDDGELKDGGCDMREARLCGIETEGIAPSRPPPHWLGIPHSLLRRSADCPGDSGAARLIFDRAAMQVDDKLVNLTPGMAVTVKIKTGSRPVIEYLLSPLLRYRQEALRER